MTFKAEQFVIGSLAITDPTVVIHMASDLLINHPVRQLAEKTHFRKVGPPTASMVSLSDQQPDYDFALGLGEVRS
ncbi:hypothetical protein C1X73_22020 [Pseudomonas sp. FW305-130]|nr:hypothetical protein C1X74_21705 [Pseudomonas sp. GW460-5]PNB55624.1 hypothetical protein C1X73_22020 [Pseudomonas sp. FW305-130]